MKTIRRPIEDRKIAGVCAGFGEYLDIDPVIVRLFTLLLLVPFTLGTVCLGYFIAWIFMPEEKT